MRVLMVGDIIGRPGRAAFAKYTAMLRREKKIDIVVANGENSSGGKGISRKSMDEMLRGGADIVTSGNHVFDNREVLDFIDSEPYLLRPANYPDGVPGKGWCVYPWRAKNIGVISMSGRAFMPPLDCPFQRAEDALRELRDECDFIFLDFHAEATSEKAAMGWYLDGRANAVVGTHTHVQTADERLLPKGTAYITDLGMTGPSDSVIGDRVDRVLPKFITGMPQRFEVAKGPNIYSAVIIELDEKTNKTIGIERVLIRE